jgi:hypothetical protein
LVFEAGPFVAYRVGCNQADAVARIRDAAHTSPGSTPVLATISTFMASGG